MRDDRPGSKRSLYNRDYFESQTKTAAAAYSWESKRSYCEIVANSLSYMEPSVMLDIGCAKGFLVALYARGQVDAYGVDVSPYALEEAPQEIRSRLFLCDVEEDRLPFDGDSFELITCLEIVEHLSIFDNLLSEWSRVLRKHGRIFVTTPAPGSWDARSDKTHVSVFSRQEWLDLFASYDFVEVSRTEWMSFKSGFISSYKSLINEVPPQRGVAKAILKLGWFGKMLRGNLQVYVNFFSPLRATQLFLLELGESGRSGE